MLRTPWVPLRRKWSRANTVIACPPLWNSQKPPGWMAPPPLKCQKSALLYKLSKCDPAPSTQVLLQPKSSGEQNAPQPKPSADQNIPQHQMATLEVLKRFMEAIVFTRTTWPILSDIQYSMVEHTGNVTIGAQKHQQVIARAAVGTQSVSQLLCGSYRTIVLHSCEDVSFGFC